METTISCNCKHDICQEDWPAAHSMCTDWFAVDENGHIAVFDTSDSGAVASGSLCKPERYYSEESKAAWAGFHEWLDASSRPGHVVFDGDCSNDWLYGWSHMRISRDSLETSKGSVFIRAHHALRSYEGGAGLALSRPFSLLPLDRQASRRR